jgi:ceramide glucosyltransferase
MVTTATLIEPFTECMLAGALGSFALNRLFGITMGKVFGWHVLIWLLLDLFQFHTLQSSSVEMTEITPEFARGRRSWSIRRLRIWLMCWCIREVTCLPLWIVAMLGRPIVTWRDQKFKVRRDMTVVELRQ